MRDAPGKFLLRFVGGLLHGLRLAGSHFRSSRFFLQTRCLGGSLRLSLLADANSFFFDGLFDALARLLSRLGPRCGKIPVLCAMQIRPGIERSYIFRGLVWVGLRVALRHCIRLEVGTTA